MGYLKPLPRRVPRGQRFGENPGLGPNPAGGHNGDDYKSWVGEPIYAAGDGEVIHAGTFDDTYADNFGWNLNYGGNMVVLNLDGANAPYVEYGHMDRIYVSARQRVRRGQVIGTTGATDGGTGVISGPHLHVGCLPPNFNLNTNTYGRVNPDLYLTDYPDDAGTVNVQSESITPLEEDMPSAQEIAAAVWGFSNPALDQRDMRQIVADVVKDVPVAVWSYANPSIGGGDAYQILRDAVANTDRIAGAVASVAAQRASEGATVEQITEAVKQAISESVVKVDVTVEGGK